MQSILNEPEPEVWPQIAPLLDVAMERLGEKDRNAIVLRLFRKQEFARSRTGFGRERGRGENAREPRAGKAAEIFHETRRGAFRRQ